MAVSGVLAPALSYALGLGEISTNSALNQPLDADIQLVSAVGEVDDVIVKLAPSAVFNQAGITRSGLLDELAFEPVDVDGEAVIKVTSKAPIQEPFINFIIEVSWPKGKLLREYTVLLDPPVLGGSSGLSAKRSASAASRESGAADGLPPFVAGAEVEPFSADEEGKKSAGAAETFSVTGEAGEEADAFVGLPETEGEAGSVVAEADSAKGGSSVGTSEIFVSMAGEAEAGAETFSVVSGESVDEDSAQVASTEAPETFSVVDSDEGAGGVGSDQEAGVSDIFISMANEGSASSSKEAADSAKTTAPSIVAGGEYQVSNGDTLSVLARKARPNKKVSVAQMMAAFLRENPNAFIKNNINSMKAGYILRVPDEAMATQVSTEEAARDLADHGGEMFSQYRSKMSEAAVPQQIADNGTKSGSESESEVEDSVAQSSDKSELEILVPDEKDAAATEGGVAGVSGVLEKEVALAKEQLESKSREVTELESRVADLEGIVTAKERLIKLKEDELSGIQQQLSKGVAAQQSKASDLDGVVAEKNQLIKEKDAELEKLQKQLSDGVATQESKIADLESAVAEKDRFIQEKEAELVDLQKRLTEGVSSQESKVADLEAAVAEKDRVVQEKDAELAKLQKQLSEGATSQESKLADLEGAVAEKDRLLQLNQAELANLQSKFSEVPDATEQVQSTGDQAGVAADDQVVADNVPEPAVDALETEAIAQVQDSSEQGNEPEGEQVVSGEAIASDLAVSSADSVEVEEGGSVVSNPNLLLGAGVGAGLLGMLGWLALRKKSPQESVITDGGSVDAGAATVVKAADGRAKPLYSDETRDVVAEYAEDAPDDATVVVDTQPEPFVEPVVSPTKREANETVEESSISIEDEAEIVAAMTAELAAGDLDLDLDVDADLSSAGDVNGLEDEVLSESNVYLAYGLHDQAIELLEPAVQSNPGRADYASKLLEAYHATGNKEAFIQAAAGLHANVGEDANNPMWQRAVVMGKDLVPDHALFSNADPGDLTLATIQSQRAELTDVGEDEEPLTEVEVDSKTLPLNRQGDDSLGFESGSGGDFDLPDLDELSQSLQMDGDEVTVALKESEDELSQEILADLTGQLEGFKPDFSHAMDLDEDANLTLADVESELTSLTTGADEMSTKLDLAKAYIDMGDDEGAREALEEVISQGDESQSGEARKLMDQIA
jgi:pilus assembly protein FimV